MKSSPTTSPSATSRKLIAAAWKILYDRRLVTSPPGSSEHRQWERDLSDLTRAQLGRGLERAKEYTGFFNQPVFRQMCKDPEDGAPDPRDAMKAYMEACMAPYPKAEHKWSHPAVYHAGKLTGWHEMASMTTEQIFPRFRRYYEELCQRAADGEDLSVTLPAALPAKVSVPLPPEEQSARMERLRKELDL